MPDADLLIAYVREHSPAFYPGEGRPLRIELQQSYQRRYSATHLFRLTWPSHTRWLRAKTPPAQPPAGAPEVTDSLRREHAALELIYARVVSLADPRLGAVRPLAFLPGIPALLMEDTRQPSLRDRMAWGLLPGRGNGRSGLLAAFANAGAWLRMFQSFPVPADAALRADDSAQSLEHPLAALALLPDDVQRRLLPVVEEAVSTHYSGAGPLVPGHGDFAPRNLLVGLGGRVTCIDTRIRWLVPPLHDLGYFLAELHTFAPRLLAGGLACSSSALSACEGAFLRGYFGEQDVPRDAARFYCLRALLEKWAANLVRHGKTSAGLRSRARGLRRRLENRAIADWCGRFRTS